MKVVALAGGVGGAKLADGLAQVLPPEDLTIVVNTGDDFEHWGLKICPDLDTVCYTLAGLANPETGWGRVDESWQVFDSVTALGGADWFRIGDRDLGTHIERTRRLNAGETLGAVTAAFCRAWGVGPRVLPMSDDPIPTMVNTDVGVLPFQEYFVHQRCEPCVSGFRFEGVEQAEPAPGALEAIENADAIIFCPSNPWVSIAPILAVPTLRSALAPPPTADAAAPSPLPKLGEGRPPGGRVRVAAVSPIIAGQALKGPAAKMYTELGIQPSALAVAQHYLDLLSGFVLDTLDQQQAAAIRALGMNALATDTVMKIKDDCKRLAEEVLQFLNK
ncbi:MAG: 2-phospho-L-lactate transferase [Anaerolineae bacterium]|nr:2-phospho-L-lactate transferase [Anaerolineae bacterium]